jgi:hypothetical protein
MNSTAVRIAALFGPAIAGILIARGGSALPFYFNGISYLVLCGAILAMRLDSRAAEAHNTRESSVRRHVLDGIVYVWRHPMLMPLIVAEVILSVFGHNNTLLTVFARDILESGAEGLGLLRSSLAVGALVGMWMLVFVRRVSGATQGKLMIVAGLMYACSIAGFVMSRWLLVSMALMAVLGVADALWGVTRNTAAQLGSPEAMRGRVMSLMVLSARGFTPLADVQAGAAIAALGPTGGGLVGAGAIAVCLVAFFKRRGLMDQEAPPTASGRPAAV